MNNYITRLNKLDGLTKIYNRSYFEKYYNTLIAQEKAFVIIIFDIDHFKSINDTYGHAIGDKVIKKVVELSQKVIGKRGTLFRYGGEEFVGIIENEFVGEVRQIAEQVRREIEAYEWQDDMKVTVSLGTAQTTDEIRDIFNLADQNLYTAKEQGRNQVV